MIQHSWMGCGSFDAGSKSSVAFFSVDCSDYDGSIARLAAALRARIDAANRSG
ncbi:MAG: hypothetical protein NTY01_05445 [Verrucomicrobia bacterium]|nr:hypothetical protein [Verrucomicrobiota bacterium]